MLEDVVQLLNQKTANLNEKKAQLEQEIIQVTDKIKSVNYLIEVTKKLNEGESHRQLQETGFGAGKQF